LRNRTVLADYLVSAAPKEDFMETHPTTNYQNTFTMHLVEKL
jgi:hypothetical protein